MAYHFQVDTNGTLTTSLVSYYPMEGNSNDVWGSKNGTDTTVTYGSLYGKVNEGVEFTASTSVITTTANTHFSGTSSYSFALWLYSPNPSSGAFILSQRNSYPPNWEFFYTSTTGYVNLLIGSTQIFSGLGFQLTTGAWSHVIITRSGTTWTAYVNGSSAATATVSVTGGTGQSFRIGDTGDNSGGITGSYVDELGLWSKALSAQEIADLYNGGAGQTMVSGTTYTKSFTPSATASVSLAKGNLFAKAFSLTASSVVSLVKTATHFLTLIPSSTVTEDSYSETNQDYSNPLSSNSLQYQEVGQTFTASQQAPLTSCKFYLEKVGSPTGTMTAKLYAMSGTYGTSGVPTGSPLATSDTIDVSTLSGSFAVVSFTFSGANQYALSAGTYYCISAAYSGGDSSNYIAVGIDISSPTATGNSYTYFSGSYFHSSTAATCFYIYGTANYPSASVSLTYAKLKSQIISVAAAASVSLAQAATHFRALTQSAASSVSLARIRTAFVSLSQSAASSVSLAALRTTYRTLSVSATSAISLAKGLLKDIALSVSSAGMASLAKGKVILTSLTQSASAAVSLAKQLIFARSLSISATGTATLAKLASVYRTLSVTATGAVTLVRGAAEAIVLSVSGTAGVSIARTKTALKTLTQSASGAVSVIRQSTFIRAITATASGTVSLTKGLFHQVTFAVSAEVTATLEKGKLFFKDIVQVALANAYLTPAITLVRTLAVSATARLKFLLNGLQSIFASRYSSQGTAFTGKYTPQGTSFSDKYEPQNTQFEDKYQ